MQYLNAHCHTEYSNIRLLDCINKVENLIDKAVELEYKGIAITDHACLSGHIKAIQHVKNQQKENKIPQDFKVILGEEIYLIDDIEKYKTAFDKETMAYYHFILLAKDEIGHRLLRKISSKAWENSYNQRRMDRVVVQYDQIAEILSQNPGHVIGSTACLGSYFSHKILQRSKGNQEEREVARKQISKIISWGKQTFGEDNFFIEIQPSIETPEQKLYNIEAYKVAEQFDIPAIVTTDAHYLTKDDREIHKAYLNSKEGDREVDDFYGSTYLMSTEEIKEYLIENGFTDEMIKNVINNTMKIYEMCENYDLQKPPAVPTFTLKDFTLNHLFSEYYDQYEYIKKFSESQSEQDQYLLYQIEEGMKEKYVFRGKTYSETEINRVNIELKELWNISEKLGERISSYYNTMRKIIDIMWTDGDSLVGPARGSVTGFYIAYLIDITQVNPIEWDLPSWRHISATRPELPKILGINSELAQRCVA